MGFWVCMLISDVAVFVGCYLGYKAGVDVKFIWSYFSASALHAITAIMGIVGMK